MRVSGQWKIDKIFERLKPPNGIKFTGPRISAKDLRDFDIEKVACVNPVPRLYSRGIGALPCGDDAHSSPPSQVGLPVVRGECEMSGKSATGAKSNK